MTDSRAPQCYGLSVHPKRNDTPADPHAEKCEDRRQHHQNQHPTHPCATSHRDGCQSGDDSEGEQDETQNTNSTVKDTADVGAISGFGR